MPPSLLVERPMAVVAHPLCPVAGAGVADEKDDHASTVQERPSGSDVPGPAQVAHAPEPPSLELEQLDRPPLELLADECFDDVSVRAEEDVLAAERRRRRTSFSVDPFSSSGTLSTCRPRAPAIPTTVSVQRTSRAGKDAVDSLAGQNPYEAVGPTPAPLVQRPAAVVSFPLIVVARVTVADEEDDHCSISRSTTRSRS